MAPRRVGEMLPVSRVGDVAGECFHPGPAFACQLAEAVGSARGCDHVRSSCVQHPRESCSQAD